MKFFCEQCKAKYQIADDKVVGKTVRMKCRKCGHLIELRAEVTESSASAGLSAGPTGVGLTTGGAAGEAASKPPAPRPPARPPPKPNALATSLTAAKPPPPKSSTAPSSALAGAFKSNVQRDHRDEESSTPFDMADLAPGDDWYVAVNGVPVGPIRVAEIRRKAALGAVTEDSLVWQEGLDEWRPLRTFPDLATNVREAATSGRISFTPPPPDVGRASIPPPRPSMRGGPPSAIPGRLTSSRPQAGAAIPVSRSNVVPFTSRLATAERLEDPPTEIASLNTLAAEPRFAPTPAPAPAIALDPFAVPGAQQAASAMAPPGGGPIVAPASLTPPPPRHRKPPPLMAYALIAGATAFGGMLGYSLFLRPAPAPAPVVQVTVPTAAPVPTVAPTETAAVLPTAEPTPSAVTTAVISGHGPVAQANKTPTAPTSTGRSLDLHGIGGGGIQPSDVPGGEGPVAPGQCLSSGQVQQVIGNHQVALRRACWERNPTTKPTVNVSVSMTVGSDGSAQSVSATGDEPSVANCIQNDVRGWRFPAMGCSQKTGFSFKFVRQ